MPRRATQNTRVVVESSEKHGLQYVNFRETQLSPELALSFQQLHSLVVDMGLSQLNRAL